MNNKTKVNKYIRSWIIDAKKRYMSESHSVSGFSCNDSPIKKRSSCVQLPK